MANPITTDVVIGTYARAKAHLVITRHRGYGTGTLSMSAPSDTLDADGHHALLQALAFPPAQPLTPVPAPGAVPRHNPAGR